jgi:hypothetical protein
VKKGELVNLTGQFEAETLRVLREIPGLSVTTEHKTGRDGDALLRFAGTSTPIAVEVKHRANAATARQLVHRAETRPDIPFLLVADETTAEAREILRDNGISVLDGLGSAHIELPGLLFHMEGHRRSHNSTGRTPPTRLSGKAGIVAQVLLLHPQRHWQVQDLAKEAQLSTGMTHRVLARLETEGIVEARGTGPSRVRRVIDPAALLDLWTEENVEDPLRTLGYLLARTPKQLIYDLGTNLGLSGIDYALTGAAGATLVAPFVTAVPVAEVWVSATAAPEELYDAAKADPVNDGQNVVFLQAKNDAPLVFREMTEGLWVANRFRLYADLRRDPRRGREQAEHLREEVIGF